MKTYMPGMKNKYYVYKEITKEIIAYNIEKVEEARKLMKLCNEKLSGHYQIGIHEKTIEKEN